MIANLLGSVFLLAEQANPLEHVVDAPRFTIDIAGQRLWLFSDVIIMLVVGAVFLMIAIPLAARRIATGKSNTITDYRTHGLWANMVESVSVYLRDDLFKPLLKGDADKFAPFLWTLFWFILVANLLGLVPLRDITGLIFLTLHFENAHGIGGTATQSLFVTSALALIAFVVINGVALSRDPVGYFKHLTAGAPPALWPIMVPIEILSIFVKPFALAMRLFANMTGGHIVVAVMMMFVKMLVDGLSGPGYLLAVLPVGTAIGIYFLEVLVAFIQAYVFVFLTTLFLGQLIVHEGHHDAHGHEDPLEEPQIGHANPHGVVAATVKH